MKKWSISILGVGLICGLAAQSTVIQWSNPSFEDIPGPGRPPLGWYFCGPPEETPPDVQPVAVMNVTTKAKHGKTYAGLVVRDNQTWETLGQAIEQPLKAGVCYLLRFYACRSDTFLSYSRLTELPAAFSRPVKLQIWAGSQHCQQELLLAETEAIEATTWQLYQVRMTPEVDCDQLFFTATFHPSAAAYNGHVLLDHLSPIISIPCDQEAYLPVSMDFHPAGLSETGGELAGVIKQQISGVQWVRNGFSLRQEVLPALDQDEQWSFGNPAIFRISDYLKDRPNALLTVAVGPLKTPLIKHHIRLLAAEFLAAGLSPDRCLIRPMRKRDLRRDNWLNSSEPEPALLWGISEE